MDFIKNTHGKTVPHDGGRGFCGVQLPLPSRTHPQNQKQTSAVYTEELTDLAATVQLIAITLQRLQSPSGWTSLALKACEFNRILTSQLAVLELLHIC